MIWKVDQHRIGDNVNSTYTLQLSQFVLLLFGSISAIKFGVAYFLYILKLIKGKRVPSLNLPALLAGRLIFTKTCSVSWNSSALGSQAEHKS